MTQERQQAILSRDGSLTAQFEPQGMSLPEALVAAWAVQRGERATAAAILGPRLEALQDGNDLDPICRDLQGTIYHLAMLDRFSLDRDYAETIRIARHLSRPEFDGYEYQSRARELAQQLPSRGADFHSFRLPDSAAWAAMQSRMSRKSQIAYLAERLRLLDCYQMMQPGGVSLWEPQYTEATHKETVWSPVRHRSPKVINPSVELDGMHLDIDDLPALAPFLLDRNFTLTYEFWRDFHPDRTLYRVNMLVAYRIHEIAGRDLAGLDDFGKLSPEEQRERVAAVEKWAGTHRGWTKRDLALESLRTSRSWSDVREAIAFATEQHMADAAPIILSRLDAFPEFPAGRRFLLQDACALDSASAAAASRRLLHDSDLDVRLTAIRILLRGHGQDVDSAIAAFRDLERADPYRYWSIEAFDDLLASGRTEAYELAAKALKADTYISGGDDAMRMAQRLFLLGRHEALSYLENQLWNPTTTWVYGPSGGGTPITTSVQDRTANDLTRWRNDMQPIAPGAPEDERVHRRRELQAWLEDQFARIWAHQPSSIVPLSTRRP